MARLWVAAEYQDDDLNRVKRLKIVMTLQTEAERAFASGQDVMIGGKSYVLGERHVLEDNIVDFDLKPQKR